MKLADGTAVTAKPHQDEEVELLRADIEDAKELHAMQVEAFKELLKKYQDFDTSPANENMEKVEARLKQDFTFYYFICIGQQKVGAGHNFAGTQKLSFI